MLAANRPNGALAGGIGLVSRDLAAMIACADRGASRPGLRADRVRLSRPDEPPMVPAVWREGERIS